MTRHDPDRIRVGAPVSHRYTLSGGRAAARSRRVLKAPEHPALEL